MKGKTRIGVAFAIAVVAGLIVAAVAYAAIAVTATMTVDKTKGVYGTEVTLTPSVDTSVVVGDKFQLQTLEDDEWVDYAEAVSVEETGEILPASLLLDGDFKYPAQVRLSFVPNNAGRTSAGMGSVDGTVTSPTTLSIVKNARTAVRISAPKRVKRGAKFTVAGQVSPISGVGNILIDRKQLGVNSGIPASYVVETDDQGFASTTMRFSVKGTYRVTMKFLGNQFGAPSKTAIATVVVR